MESNSEQVISGKVNQVVALMRQLGIDRDVFERIEEEFFPEQNESDSDIEIVDLSTHDASMLRFPSFEELSSRIQMDREDYNRTPSVWEALGQFDYSSYTPLFSNFFQNHSIGWYTINYLLIFFS